ncbi:hypothetical protein ABES25_24065 [Bacillus gobiensis]|uniref:hypothetical protein n=1 Tax=Bacillus gobiensis TaxID=1441095 RepID=UPI003D229BAD
MKVMKMFKPKKVIVPVIMMVFSLIMTVSVPFTASAAGWDYMGEDWFRTQSKNFYSGGGDFMICLDSSSPKGNYYLFEEDPYNPDDQVKSGVYFGNSTSDDFYYTESAHGLYCHVFRDVNAWVDGSNNQAEFYVKRYSDNGTVYVEAWD